MQSLDDRRLARIVAEHNRYMEYFILESDQTCPTSFPPSTAPSSDYGSRLYA